VCFRTVERIAKIIGIELSDSDVDAMIKKFYGEAQNVEELINIILQEKVLFNDSLRGSDGGKAI
jgi:hypothetical protein